MKWRHLAPVLFAASLVVPVATGLAEGEKHDSAVLIEWLLQDGRELRGIPFSEVLASTTGKKILTVPPDATWLPRLGVVLDRTLAELNDPAHPIHSVGRINEASRFIEDQLMAECNKEPGWSCGIPRTSAGEEQRSGYPDLRLVLEDQSVVYLDPKLFARGSKTSTLRTFYYEPQTRICIAATPFCSKALLPSDREKSRHDFLSRHSRKRPSARGRCSRSSRSMACNISSAGMSAMTDYHSLLACLPPAQRNQQEV